MGNIMNLTNEKSHYGNNTQTITSLEVAEMVGKQHNELLKDIRRYAEQLGEGKIPHTDFFIESTYVTEQNKTMPCFDVTKKGCEFIANKLTGVKGAVFTAKFINRFHDMEDYVKNDSVMLISFKEQVQSLEAVSDMLRMNEASKLLMLENFYKQYNIPTEFLPKYEYNENRRLKALTVLLKENGCGVSAVKFNQKLIECGYLEEIERPSSKSGTKKFKALTENGLKYGENAISPHNQREVQPLYYEDSFVELYNTITK